MLCTEVNELNKNCEYNITDNRSGDNALNEHAIIKDMYKNTWLYLLILVPLDVPASNEPTICLYKFDLVVSEIRFSHRLI